jgi:hypothetical protein
MSIAVKKPFGAVHRLHLPEDYFEPALPLGSSVKLQHLENRSSRDNDHDDFFGPFMPPFVLA